MRIRKTWIFFACFAICSLISTNAGSDETLQVVKSYSLPVPHFSFIDFNPLSKVDEKILNEYDIPVFAEGMAATQEALYLIADKKIHRFDSERRMITNTYSLPFPDAMGLAWDGIYFYVSQFNSNKVSVFELR